MLGVFTPVFLTLQSPNVTTTLAMLTIKKGAPWVLLIALALCGCTPPGPRALLQGKQRLDKGKYKEAVAKLEVATGILRTNAAAWNYLGLAYHLSGRPDDAEKAYLRALNLNRSLSEARYNLGCLHVDQGKLDLARSDFTAYTLENDKNVEAFLALGSVCSRLGDLSGAERAFQRVLKLAPENPQALNGLGLVRQKRGRSAEAAEYLARAVKADGEYAPALLNYAVVAQQSLKDRPLALRLYQQYVNLKPAPTNAAAVSATISRLQAEIASSSPASQQARAAVVAPVRPSLAPSRTNVPAQAPQVARSASTTSKTSAPATSSSSAPVTGAAKSDAPTEVVKLRPEAEIRQGGEVKSAPAAASQPAQAPVSAPAKSAETAAQKQAAPKRSVFSRLFGTPAAYSYRKPSKPAAGNRAAAETSFSQAVRARQEHRVTDAVQAYKEAIKKDPSFFNAHFNLAVVQTELGNLQDAAASYETALAIQPDSLDARYNFALLLKQMGYPSDAAKELERVVADHPSDARGHITLGNLYAQEFKQNGKAREQYTKALEADPSNPQAPAIRQWLADPRN